MNCTDLIRYYKSREKAMKTLGVNSRQLWHIWQCNGIPMSRQAEIQLATRGKLRVGK